MTGGGGAEMKEGRDGRERRMREGRGEGGKRGEVIEEPRPEGQPGPISIQGGG